MRPPALSALSAVLLSSCVSGPPQEKSTLGNSLNGEHYANTGSVLGVPVLERKPERTTLRGTIHVEDPLTVVPASVRVDLTMENEIYATTTANRSGSFELTGNFPNGTYTLFASAPHFEGHSTVKIDSYLIEQLEIALRKKP